MRASPTSPIITIETRRTGQARQRQDRLSRTALLLLPPLTAFWLMQFVLGAMPWEMSVGAAAANWLVLGGLYWTASAVTGRAAVCCVVLHLLAGLWGAANYFVSVFRGTPILPWDFTALGTAAAVAGSYRFFLTWRMGTAVVLWVLLAAGLRHQYRRERFRPAEGDLRRRGSLLLAGLVCLIPVFRPQLLGALGVETDVWDQIGAYRSGGAAAEFLRNMEFMKIQAPADTTPERAAEIVEDVGTDPAPAADVDRPNIVAIMNESWADFEDYGNLSLSESVMDYIDGLEGAVRGHAYTSVFGAGTSASEFEFLTGDSMAFLPSGSIPYQQYVLGPSDSLATLLKGYGYDTLAFHPGERTSWQRNSAYPRLGFDAFKCGEDMDVPQTEEHGYVSDDSDFKQIIWEFEHKEAGKPLFLFNVTIQNHGSYTVEDYPAQVHLTDEPGRYPKAEQYLTLANKTDEAFHLLVDYFKQQEEPTIIVMFGDHQPSVEQEFLDKAYGVTQDQMTMEQYMGKFKVPFVIWANYPLEGEAPEITSLNFLAQYVLRDAGIQTSLFGSYLWDLQKTLPAVTFAGYWDAEGNAHSHLEENGRFDALIQDYERVQYNELFGGKDRVDRLFASPGNGR
ncbi:LTA synthase family protein [Pseudoflavonifractor sp. MSJ-37]|uniref:LTA synthase family protein n=1 Tax=Pseudoflavonifractor sp. MSJ-37 TaxID=2841531 RepID=UPI001C113EE5|nr:LTA synthase family protein [Pseudoflavonifractor sp. MSJ-37]MBU5435889.1 sulfatase-like hydrolase/transferase [Pseudoflavonifractor sp. MSJ-37]